jgi:hypothetical protein
MLFNRSIDLSRTASAMRRSNTFSETNQDYSRTLTAPGPRGDGSANLPSPILSATRRVFSEPFSPSRRDATPEGNTTRRTAVRISDRVEEHRYDAHAASSELYPAHDSGLLPSSGPEGRVKPPVPTVSQALGSNLKLHSELAERDAFIQRLNEGCTKLENR